MAVEFFASQPTLGASAFPFRRAEGLQRRLARISTDYDVVHIHLSRDLTTLPAGLGLRIPYIIQPHGMLSSRSSTLHRLIDFAVTSRVIRGASAAIALNEEERRWLKTAGAANTVVVANPAATFPSSGPKELYSDTVLFLARLHERKRPQMFAHAASEIIREDSAVRFVMAGPDEGAGPDVNSILSATNSDRLRWIGAVDASQCSALMRDAAVYVLPARNEPFGMTFLEAIAHGTPIISDSSSSLGAELARLGLGRIFDGTTEGLVEAVKSVLNDHTLRTFVAQNGANIVQDRWGTDSVAQRLESLYSEATMQ